jgi:flagellar hook-associated protein 3 FlgL
MSRIATSGSYHSALSNLMTAQTRAAEAQERYSTQKNATDLVGFGRQSETLTALKGSQSRLQGFINAADTVTGRLTIQDLAMTRVQEGIGGIADAINNALAADSAVTMMLEISNNYQDIRGGLNTKYHGAYLFSGASVSIEPVDAKTLADLAAAPTTAALFKNDTVKSASRVAENTVIETGFLADDLGTEIADILRDIQNFHTGPNGPLSGKLTDAQKTFLTAQVTRLSTASQNSVEQVALSGSMAKQVETVSLNQQAQLTSLEKLVTDRTDADMAKAFADMQLAQQSIEASAQVVASLRENSLLNFLR